MEKIASFCVDHNKLLPGIYISRIDGDIVTYDIRMRKPNVPPFLENAALHTIEHLFATFSRNGKFKEQVIYFGPMGCRTGFYFLVRNMDSMDVVQLIKDAFAFIADFEGEIPGASAVECGNYLEHDLEGAKNEAREFLPIIEGWCEENLRYLS
ncbi:S-ribosylhomocysteine lyase [Caproiciproducens galactitolivorans]|uniref:S-ribosylhomocysteine lyase n=1 Tax=Caproiciproducens galactitolivorans TaxID=642589 RepID=A0A4Z0Y9Y3_9FIRM|nr:S-ribosylhomocysteine lyase [Caproiciproducens galactitolivorans]QEY33974.1 S-ribosylhomocysteine lyase [Caproiciproducens galactitolivorans]TGJ76061.1 S-ribosylhomocysteine lyase [Caproiciproducens galactitolivorans]